VRRPRIGIRSRSAPVPVAEGTLASHRLGLAFTRALDSVGGVPVVLTAVEGHEEEDAFEPIGAVDGILLSGLTDIHPATYGQALDREWIHDLDTSRDRPELALLARARGAGPPILGVHRDLRLLNAAYVGALDQHPAPFALGTLRHPEQTARREATLRMDRALVEAAGRRHG